MRSTRVAAAAAVLVLASCSGSPQPSPSSQTSSPTSAPQAEFPVDKLLVEVTGRASLDDWYRLEHERFEELVAECMRAAGFEYVPEPWLPETEEVELTPERAASVGYGIVIDPGEAEVPPSPNDAYVDSLDDESLARYMEALEGPADPEDHEDEGMELDLGEEGMELDLEELDEDGDGVVDLGGLDEEELDGLEPGDDAVLEGLDDDLEAGGCQGEAITALLADPLPYDDPEHSEVVASIEDLTFTALEHEDVLAAQEAWAACMAEGGYPELEGPESAVDIVWDAVDAAWEEAPEDAEELDAATVEELAALEVAVATADAACREQAGLAAAERAARESVETEFLAENRDAVVAYFEALRDALGD